MDKIICIGKNYLDHAKELGDAVPEKPVLFLKPPSVLVSAKQMGETLAVSLPRNRGAVHHECEIVVRINAQGTIDAVTLGLDMTLRNVQEQLKKNGHPWEIGKVFAGSAILGPWISLAEFPDYLERDFSFSLDGKLRQQGRGNQMRLLPKDCVSYAREFFPLCEGDVIFTGTPAGVGPVQAGQPSELRWGDHTILRVQWTELES
jgi:2-keto-4-pentenoate hydratase/2-oxohepta-3-ene-1,7-dioic acid hydratase in catechol pathway